MCVVNMESGILAILILGLVSSIIMFSLTFVNE